MSLPTEIYVWDEATRERPLRDLNLERDGGRPTPEPGAREPLRAGVYKLVREVEITCQVTETSIKQAIDPLIDSWGPSALRALK